MSSIDDINKKLSDLVEIRDKMESLLIYKRKDYYETIKKELVDKRTKNENYKVHIQTNISLNMWSNLDMIDTFENFNDKVKLCELHDVTSNALVTKRTDDFEKRHGPLTEYTSKSRMNSTFLHESFL